MIDTYHLNRFVEAQASVYTRVIGELQAGCKHTHWMWFIFPQLEGLGLSTTARHFAISSLEEAQHYLHHPMLGPRLLECTTLALKSAHLGATKLFGQPDDLKFRSSMTLFNEASNGDQVFHQALNRFFDGVPDQLTLAKLRVSVAAQHRS